MTFKISLMYSDDCFSKKILYSNNVHQNIPSAQIPIITVHNHHLKKITYFWNCGFPPIDTIFKSTCSSLLCIILFMQ